MNEQDLTRAIANKFFLTQRESREIIDFILAKITEDLANNKRTYFRGFGSFAVVKHAAKKVRHPRPPHR